MTYFLWYLEKWTNLLYLFWFSNFWFMTDSYIPIVLAFRSVYNWEILAAKVREMNGLFFWMIISIVSTLKLLIARRHIFSGIRKKSLAITFCLSRYQHVAFRTGELTISWNLTLISKTVSFLVKKKILFFFMARIPKTETWKWSRGQKCSLWKKYGLVWFNYKS